MGVAGAERPASATDSRRSRPPSGLRIAPSSLLAAADGLLGAGQRRYSVDRTPGGAPVARGGGLSVVFGAAGPAIRAAGGEAGLSLEALGARGRLTRVGASTPRAEGNRVSYPRRQDWAWAGRYEQILGTYTYAGKSVYGFAQTSSGVPLDSWGRNVYLDTDDAAYGTGWNRENSFLAEPVDGEFCYSLGPRAPYPGDPSSGPWDGTGKMYRITALGPRRAAGGDVGGAAVGPWNPNDPADLATEQKVDALKLSLGFAPTKCHT